jgi:predicted lipoprotein with Yx(FWY)xxD motif
MKRAHILIVGVLAVAVSASAIANAQAGAPRARSASAAKVELRHTRIGTILTTASGSTLYEFTRDGRDEDSCVKVHGCSALWPALETHGRPLAGAGVKSSLLSTIHLAGGGEQVAYAGHALYTYAEGGAGDTAYVGAEQFGGSWYALNASGRAIR